MFFYKEKSGNSEATLTKAPSMEMYGLKIFFVCETDFIVPEFVVVLCGDMAYCFN